MAKILDITPISDAAQMPVKKGTLKFIQDAHKDSLNQALLAMVGDSYNALNAYVMWGCVNSGSFPAYDITAGAVWYLGEVYEVPAASFSVTGSNVAVLNITTTQYTTNADPVTFTDASSHNVHNIRKITISSGASGSGVANYSDVVFDALRFPQATETAKGVAEIATQAETDSGLNDTNIVTPAKLQGSYGMVKSDWDIDNTTTNWATSNANGNITSSLIYIKKIGKVVHVEGKATLVVAGGTCGVAEYTLTGISTNGLITLELSSVVNDGSVVRINNLVQVQSYNPAKITVFSSNDISSTFAIGTYYLNISVTFKCN
jgi:hypothetical protein